MDSLTPIVVALDFSEVSRDVLQHALQLARASSGAAIHLLHVVPDPLHQPWAVEAIGIDFVALEKAWVADAERQLAETIAAAGIAAAGATPVVRVGRAADTIVAYADEVGAGVIVMGTHGYGPVKRFMMGSVAERVLRQAACPVFTVPHRGLRTDDGHDAPAAV